MTVLQSHTTIQSKYSYILSGVLLVLVVVSVVILIGLYNQSIGFAHSAEEANRELARIQADNARIKEGTLALFEASSIASLVTAQGLTIDRSPLYREIIRAWEVASR